MPASIQSNPVPQFRRLAPSSVPRDSKRPLVSCICIHILMYRVHKNTYLHMHIWRYRYRYRYWCRLGYRYRYKRIHMRPQFFDIAAGLPGFARNAACYRVRSSHGSSSKSGAVLGPAFSVLTHAYRCICEFVSIPISVSISLSLYVHV